MYPEYEYYKNEYGGKAIINVDDFYFCYEKAKAYIRKITFNRASGDENFLRQAVCNLCDCIKRKEDRKGVIHEEIDGCRVDYKDNDMSELFNCAVFFIPSDLLYRGI